MLGCDLAGPRRGEWVVGGLPVRGWGEGGRAYQERRQLHTHTRIVIGGTGPWPVASLIQNWQAGYPLGPPAPLSRRGEFLLRFPGGRRRGRPGPPLGRRS